MCPERWSSGPRWPTRLHDRTTLHLEHIARNPIQCSPAMICIAMRWSEYSRMVALRPGPNKYKRQSRIIKPLYRSRTPGFFALGKYTKSLCLSHGDADKDMAFYVLRGAAGILTDKPLASAVFRELGLRWVCVARVLRSLWASASVLMALGVLYLGA